MLISNKFNGYVAGRRTYHTGMEPILLGAEIGGGTSALAIDTGAGTADWTFAGGDLFPSAGATTMTEGFVWIPSAAGAPTGTPATTNAGIAPMYFDHTNNKLYVYNSTGTPAWIAIN